jgi:hypothetical protein
MVQGVLLQLAFNGELHLYVVNSLGLIPGDFRADLVTRVCVKRQWFSHTL